MSIVAEEPKTVEAPAFDPAKYAADRMAGKTPERAAEPVKAPEPVKAAEPEKKPQEIDRHAVSRSARREINKLREELGYYRAKAEAVADKPAEKAEDLEPQRATFNTDAEYLRATQKWDARQAKREAEAKAGETGQTEELRTHLRAMDEKAVEDAKSIDDWDEVQKAAAEDEDSPEFSAEDHPTLMGMLARSEFRAYALYYFAKNPTKFQEMLDLTATPEAQIRAFHRLEGRLEKEYTSEQAAPAPKEKAPSKDRKHLAEAAKPGETAADRDIRKPKPSAELTARGGSPAPEDAPVGSPAWTQQRMLQRYGASRS